MTGFDTNVLLRPLLRDDEELSALDVFDVDGTQQVCLARRRPARTTERPCNVRTVLRKPKRAPAARLP